MSIGSSSAALASQSSSVNGWQQKHSNFQSLKTALQSGDLTAAQNAFSAISANNPNIPSSSPLGQIGAALQSGNITGAQQIGASMQAGRMDRDGDGGGQLSANSVASATGTAFLSAFLGAISPSAATSSTASTGATGATSSSSSTATSPSLPSTTLTGTATPSVNQITQDVTSFLQNLFTSLGQGAPGSMGSAGFSSPIASSPTSTTSAALGALSGSTGTSGTSGVQPYNPGFQQGYAGAVNQLSSSLQTLISQLEGSSAAASTGTGTATTTADNSTIGTTATTSTNQPVSTTASQISQLQQSFGTLISDAGGTANNSSLTSFLQNFEQNLQTTGTTGSFINLQA